MIAEAITQLEGEREALLERALQIEAVIDALRGLQNGVTEKPKRTFTIGPDTRRKKIVEETREAILTALGEHGPLTNKQIAHRLRMGESTVSSYTHKLLDDHLIQIVRQRGHQRLYAIVRGMATDEQRA